MRVAVIGPAFPYKGGGARHTTELAHRLTALGHDVVIESWRAQYPSFLYPGQQTIDVPEGEPFPGTRRDLDWRRPDGWLRCGRRLRGVDQQHAGIGKPALLEAPRLERQCGRTMFEDPSIT